MNQWSIFVRIAVAAYVTVGVLFAQVAWAQVELLPNLEPFSASDVQLVSGTSGLELRFSTTSWNRGLGPLQLRGELDSDPTKKNVSQWVRLSDGTYNVYPVGTFEFHAGTHNHFHLEDYARYTLQPVDAPGASALEGAKVSFCLLDNVKVNTHLTNAAKKPVYTVCNPDIQGISVGWGDRYASHLDGQSLPFGDNPSGDYLLKIEIDPLHNLHESNTGDNIACARVRIDVNTLSATVIGTSCDTAPAVSVTDITPPSVRAGSSVPVVITGSGFVAGVSVTFANGSGKVPVASNVVVSGGGTTITANVSVATGGSSADPVWDLRVGAAALLNSFTVIR